MMRQHALLVGSFCTPTLQHFPRAAEQRAEQLLSSGLQALYSETTGFVKRKMHKVQFDIEPPLSGRFQLLQ